MPRYEQVICPTNPNHLHSSQNGSNRNGMHTIDADRVHTLKPAEWSPIFICEAGVGTQRGYGSAEFNPGEHVSFRQVRMFYRDGRLAIDAGIPELPQDECREPQPLVGPAARGDHVPRREPSSDSHQAHIAA